jgi:hypothetical protein
MRKKVAVYQGQAVTEYAIAGTCLGVVCLVGLGLFSIQLGELFSRFREQLNIEVAGVSGIIVAHNDLTQPDTVLFTLRDGSQIALVDQLALDPAELIETAGVNGYTTAMANNISLISSLLKQKDILADNQVSALIELANQGHRIGLLQSEIEKALRVNVGIDLTLIEPVYFEGKEYSVMTLATTLSSRDIYPGTSEIDEFINGAINGSNFSGSLTNQGVVFAQAYLDAKETGALDNPSIKKLIDYFVVNIFKGAEHFEHYIHLRQNPLSEDKIHSLITHLNSTGICHTGGEEDSGVQCQ